MMFKLSRLEQIACIVSAIFIALLIIFDTPDEESIALKKTHQLQRQKKHLQLEVEIQELQKRKESNEQEEKKDQAQ